ncbi:hypothetical protein [Streptomyces sp. NPDC002088]|uniref:hypothetical protein n=1 Tax=Streptomyces sp. NPDC002088 TaxID=3154665 RepID=UPI0033262E08
MTRRKAPDDRPTTIAVLTLLALLASLSIWSWTSAPCGLWKYAKAGETPARCLMQR